MNSSSTKRRRSTMCAPATNGSTARLQRPLRWKIGMTTSSRSFGPPAVRSTTCRVRQGVAMRDLHALCLSARPRRVAQYRRSIRIDRAAKWRVRHIPQALTQAPSKARLGIPAKSITALCSNRESVRLELPTAHHAGRDRPLDRGVEGASSNSERDSARQVRRVISTT